MTSPALWHVLNRNGAACDNGRGSIRTALRCHGNPYSAGDCPWCFLRRLLLPGRLQAHDVVFPDLLETLQITESKLQDMDVMRDSHFGQFHQRTLIEPT